MVTRHRSMVPDLVLRLLDRRVSLTVRRSLWTCLPLLLASCSVVQQVVTFLRVRCALSKLHRDLGRLESSLISGLSKSRYRSSRIKALLFR